MLIFPILKRDDDSRTSSKVREESELDRRAGVMTGGKGTRKRARGDSGSCLSSNLSSVYYMVHCTLGVFDFFETDEVFVEIEPTMYA